MATIEELHAEGDIKIRRPEWNDLAYLELHVLESGALGDWPYLYDVNHGIGDGDPLPMYRPDLDVDGWEPFAPRPRLIEIPEPEHVTEQRPYGDLVTGESDVYALAGEFLTDCATVEDWGCGRGWFRNFVAQGYRGIDYGVDLLHAHNEFVDEYADLRYYTSEVDGIFMRAVLEHNLDWRPILANAVASFRHKFCLVIFTPFSEETHPLSFDDRPRYVEPVPDMSFRFEDITEHFEGLYWDHQRITNRSQYSEETLFYVTRPGT